MDRLLVESASQHANALIFKCLVGTKPHIGLSDLSDEDTSGLLRSSIGASLRHHSLAKMAPKLPRLPKRPCPHEFSDCPSLDQEDHECLAKSDFIEGYKTHGYDLTCT